MLVSQLAQETGVTSHTLRYYEKEGLLDKRYIQRTRNNYRDYSAEAVERIMAIRVLHAAGFTLLQIKDLLGRWDSGLLTATEALIALQKKIDAIDAHIAELRRVKQWLVKGMGRHIKRARRKKVGNSVRRRAATRVGTPYSSL